MQKQYLILAEQISFRNNKLCIINTLDQFMALQLPARFNFDLAFICGPEWEPGEYDLVFKVKSADAEPIELGTIKVNIATDKSVFNAIASNLNFNIEGPGDISFIVEKNGEEIFTRTYPVRGLIELAHHQEEQVES